MSIEYYGSYYGDKKYEFAFRSSKKTMSRKKANANKNNSIINKLYIHGTFEVRFLSDSNSQTFIVNKTINKDAELVKTVIYQNVGSTFEINGEKVKLLKKNLFYSSKRSNYEKKYN